MTADTDRDPNMLAFDELLKERRRDRFWRNVRFGLIIAIAIAAMAIQGPSLGSLSGGTADQNVEGEPYVAMVSLTGGITEGNPRASDDGLKSQLTEAFEDENAEGVVIKISSPGGTPVQSNLIRERIERLKQETGKRVIVVGEESMASGAYLIAMAGDKIYAQSATIVGSIGVRMTSFGASGLIEKVGVERRIYTAGEKKVSLDPFQPESEQAVEHTKSILNDIHNQFIEVVKANRGEKVDYDNEDLFSGEFWTGRQSLPLGLIDGIATVSDATEEEFGTRHVRSYGPPNNILTRLGIMVQSATEIFSKAGSTQVESVWTL